MSVISYRKILDKVREYFPDAYLIDVARLAKENFDYVYAKMLERCEVVIWDETVAMDNRSIEQFKKEVFIEPDKQKLFYILKDGAVVGAYTLSPYDQEILTQDNVESVSKQRFDEYLLNEINNELVSIIVDKLTEQELEKEK